MTSFLFSVILFIFFSFWGSCLSSILYKRCSPHNLCNTSLEILLNECWNVLPLNPSVLLFISLFYCSAFWKKCLASVFQPIRLQFISNNLFSSLKKFSHLFLFSSEIVLKFVFMAMMVSLILRILIKQMVLIFLKCLGIHRFLQRNTGCDYRGMHSVIERRTWCIIRWYVLGVGFLGVEAPIFTWIPELAEAQLSLSNLGLALIVFQSKHPYKGSIQGFILGL